MNIFVKSEYISKCKTNNKDTLMIQSFAQNVYLKLNNKN